LPEASDHFTELQWIESLVTLTVAPGTGTPCPVRIVPEILIIALVESAGGRSAGCWPFALDQNPEREKMMASILAEFLAFN
jgi:hypothetical protein